MLMRELAQQVDIAIAPRSGHWVRRRTYLLADALLMLAVVTHRSKRR
jgi:hypothetical protein